jgi:multiphosphoryl transfer protein
MPQRSDHSSQYAFSCPLASGLHARPASHLADVVNEYAADCSLTNLRNGRVANGRSVLGIIAADIRQGDRCSVHFYGADAQAALGALRRFVETTLPHCDVPLAPIEGNNRRVAPPRLLQAAKATCIPGIPVSRGLGQGIVVVLKKMSLPTGVGARSESDPQKDLARITGAVNAVRQRIGEKLKYSLTPAGTAVLQADLAMAGDVLLLEKLREQVLAGKTAGQAVVEAGEFFIDLLGHSENEYIRQRSADIEEICLQLLEEVCETKPPAAIALTQPTVLVAETLAPQQLLELDLHWLKGLVIEHSAATSHAAILARSLGIPTLAGVRNARLVLTSGRDVVVDANRGFVVPQSSPAVLRFYERERETLNRRRALRTDEAGKTEHAGKQVNIEIGANAASGEELSVAFENGADGIGLFRTEMIFLGREDAPTEDEQFAIYSEAARSAGGRPVIIRTFDIGGDKRVPYLNLPHEDNPFLGYRGIRVYPEHREPLQSQLRAILRASAAGCIRIMAPMVTSLEELLQFKAEVARARQDLEGERVTFQGDLQIGMMVEVPSVAFSLRELCEEADFFSIGTNDLSQYFFAADRGNSKIASRFTVRHPAFLRFLKQVVDQIRQAGKWVGMCGEMAADLRNIPLLLGLGLNEISVPAAEVHDFKRAVAKVRNADCVGILERATACRQPSEVDRLLTERSHQPEPLLSDDLVLLESASLTKEEAIHEMVDAFYLAGRTEDRDLLEEALWAREAEYSTGLGHGFAIPHCKTDAVSANSICILRLNEPIDWDSIHGEKVRMVVLLALRQSEVANTHMQVFSSLARKLDDDEFRQHLLKFKTPQQVTGYLAEQLGVDSLVLNQGSLLPEGPSPPQIRWTTDR